MTSSAFEVAYGFSRGDVRLGNWRQAPWNVWAFRHVSEFIPTARIAATPGLTEEPPVVAEDLIRREVCVGEEKTTIADILRRTSTDAQPSPHFSATLRNKRIKEVEELSEKNRGSRLTGKKSINARRILNPGQKKTSLSLDHAAGDIDGCSQGNEGV
jgi:hypothetical protein